MEPTMFLAQPGLKKQNVDHVKNIVEKINSHSEEKITMEAKENDRHEYTLVMGFVDQNQKTFFYQEMAHQYVQ
jgi:hypothetical protein